MAKKKATTPKRKTTSRKKKTVAAAKTPESPEDTDTPETVVAEAATSTTQEKPEQPRTKRKRPARRSSRKKTAAKTDASAAPAAPEQETTPESPAGDKETAQPKPTRKKRSRRRSSKKTKSPAATSAAAPVDAAPASTVRPMSPTAEVEQKDDTIVIRFPSATPQRGTNAPPPSEPPQPEEPVEAAGPMVSSNGTIEPPIDWEAEPVPADSMNDAEPDLTAEAPPMDDTPAPVDRASGGESPAEAGGAANGAEAAPSRSKRRRRRRRRDPRQTPAAEHAGEERPAPVVERQRPESTAEAAEQLATTGEERPSRRRRRRSRRSRKPDAAVPTEGSGEAAAPAEAKDGAEPPPAQSAQQKEMIINVVPKEECRIAIMESGKLQEIYLERASSENYVGNIYKGIITNVEPSIQAAFVDFGQGQGKNGFLHISDLHPQYFPNGERHTENVGRKMPRRSRPPIQRCLRRGQQLLVQITKEGIGTKGPTLTTYLSIPGRFLVMMPGMRQLGVSRKIEDDEARRKLRDQLVELELPDDIGFIARTAALDRTKRELQSDLNYLTRLWRAVGTRIDKMKAPAEIYTESDLVIRTIRDVYATDITRIIVDDPEVAERAHEFLSIFSPRSRDIVIEYEHPEPIFHHYGIEAELERLHSRHVPLKSGGSLVIDQTEALVAIDVNSGRFRTEDDAEATAYKINLEAADEIPRQLRLRDLGGVVICDFIDMRMEKHKREIERRLNRNLKEHKERAKILRMSEFGIIELTRQRQRASLTRSVYQDCRHCHGTGLVKTKESVVLDVMRLIQLAATRENVYKIEVTVSAEVANPLQNRKRGSLHTLESRHRCDIRIFADAAFSLDDIRMYCKDPRGRLVLQFP